MSARAACRGSRTDRERDKAGVWLASDWPIAAGLARRSGCRSFRKATRAAVPADCDVNARSACRRPRPTFHAWQLEFVTLAAGRHLYLCHAPMLLPSERMYPCRRVSFHVKKYSKGFRWHYWLPTWFFPSRQNVTIRLNAPNRLSKICPDTSPTCKYCSLLSIMGFSDLQTVNLIHESLGGGGGTLNASGISWCSGMTLICSSNSTMLCHPLNKRFSWRDFKESVKEVFVWTMRKFI